jgi:peptidoglycan/xylan/chitin deacetylase (PgdA/CDA1 family)
VTETLHAIADEGHEIAVHGSYRSLEEPGRLAREYEQLSAIGFRATGGRQHWLRHRGGELFAELVRAGAAWDATSGHPDDIGYRHGAAFPFLPYDFDSEQPYPVVEIPLVVMDRALCRETNDPDGWADAAIAVLRAADRDGWGGVSVLWHDSVFTRTALPARLADAYWSVLDAGDRWVTAMEVAAAAQSRWEAAGAVNAGKIPVDEIMR